MVNNETTLSHITFDELVSKYINDEIDFQQLEENFELALENVETIEQCQLRKLFNKDDKSKNLVLRELKKIMGKLIFREDFLADEKFFLNPDNLNQYVDNFFVEVNKSNVGEKKSGKIKVVYSVLLYKISEVLGYNEGIKLIDKNIDTIIEDCNSIATVINTINEHIAMASMEAGELSEIIDRIDTALANNIDTIVAKKETRHYNYAILSADSRFPKFKAAIKSNIERIRYKIFLESTNDFNKYFQISQELFGKVDEETLASLKFGVYGEEKAKIIGIIMKELREKSQGDISVHDIKRIGSGTYCEAFLIGDYVLKLGQEREAPRIKNNKRILQPIIRQQFYAEKTGNIISDMDMYYIEVQNAVDANWFRKIEESKAEEILYKVYVDFRKQGLIWTDVKVSNVGRLIKPNRVNYTFTDTDKIEKDIQPTEEATGIDGEIAEEDILQPGDYVVLDTDYIFDEEEALGRKLQGFANQFEYRYQRELARGIVATER